MGSDLPRPSLSITRVLARRLCPDRIIQPQPVSLVNPWGSPRLLNLTDNVMDDAAFGSCDFGMGGNSERYDIHNFVSKSSRKATGHPPSAAASSSGSPFTDDAARLLVVPVTSDSESAVDLLSVGSGDVSLPDGSFFEANEEAEKYS